MVKNEKINTVFFEEFASPKVAQTIAKATNVKIDTLRPDENRTCTARRFQRAHSAT